jgi:DNA-binding CsgD family transcriptional regulator
LAQRAPTRPLLDDELRRANELLTPQELTVYRHRRGGQSWNWIAAQLGVSRTRVVHLFGRAEKKLGFEPSVTLKRKAAYKPIAQRKAEDAETSRRLLEEWKESLEPDEFERVLGVLAAHGAAESEEEREELERLLRPRLEQLVEARRARADVDDDWSRAVGQDAADFAAELEATFGTNELTDEPMQPGDFIEDDGKGYDRL